MMTRNRHNSLVLGPAVAVAALLALCAPASAAASSPKGETLSPLPESDYTVRSVCPEPAPGYAGCLAMELVPATHAARAHSHPLGMTLRASSGTRRAAEACEPPTAAAGCFGLRPEDLHDAYSLPTEAVGPQTIALVDAYNDPTAEADLKVYDEEYGLPACTTANHCFKQANQKGETSDLPFPKSSGELTSAREAGDAAEREEAEEAEGWTVEMSLDIETAHAVCQNCSIALVEAESPTIKNLEAAVEAAAGLGATDISNSWGGVECAEESGERECLPDGAAFKQPHTVITASAGDDGYKNWTGAEKGYADFPASSPRVVAVGGTRLLLSAEDKRASETVWNDGGESGGVPDGHGAGGGGCSAQFNAPLWQSKLSDWSSVGCGSHRAVADVSADADPYTGLAVYDSSAEECASAFDEEVEGEEVEQVVHWCTIGGTSLASPLVASVFALAGGANGVEYPARTLYYNETAEPSSLYDVTEGSNGECDKPFEEPFGELGRSGCSSSEEAAASCSSHLSCLAGSGYDGPTGVGTPNGLGAFEPPVGGFEESEGEDEEGGGGGGGGPTHGASHSSAELLPSGSQGGGLLTEGSGSTSLGEQAAAKLSGLGLTTKAIVALDRSHPRLAQLGFSFTSNVQMLIRVSLQKRTRKHKHVRWKPFGQALSVEAGRGHNTDHLGGRAVLGGGTYRLTLTPVVGEPRSIVFQIG